MSRLACTWSNVTPSSNRPQFLVKTCTWISPSIINSICNRNYWEGTVLCRTYTDLAPPSNPIQRTYLWPLLRFHFIIKDPNLELKELSCSGLGIPVMKASRCHRKSGWSNFQDRWEHCPFSPQLLLCFGLTFMWASSTGFYSPGKQDSFEIK